MFTFAWPYVFLLLPLPWFFLKYWPKKEKKNEAMLKIPFLSRIQSLNEQASIHVNTARQFRKLLQFAIWLLLIIACANPRWLGKPLPINQSSRNIMLAIDLSQSMGIPDLQKNNHTLNRLQILKNVAVDFIEKRQGDKLGLILFGSKAYLQTPLTHDRKTVHSMLDDATIGLAGGYTAIGDAIGLAVKKLRSEDINSRILILFTDGGNNSGNLNPIESAQLAKDNKIKIYTVGIGASQMVISGFFGPQMINPSSDLDETTLKKIADLTQGKYFRAEDEKALGNVLNAISELEPINSEINTVRPITALFYWPLSGALLLISIFIFPFYRTKSRL